MINSTNSMPQSEQKGNDQQGDSVTEKRETEIISLKAPYTFRYVFWDIVLRWVVAVLWWLSDHRWWETGLLWLFQLIIIPIVVFVFAISSEERATKEMRERENISQQKHISLSPIVPAWATFVNLVIVFIGSWIGVWITGIESNWLKWLLGIVFFLVYGFYLVVVNTSSFGRLASASEGEFTEDSRGEALDDRDLNDVEIARVDVLAQSQVQRVDTYTLEAALFGALAFSSFIAILFSDYSLLSNVSEVVSKIAYNAPHTFYLSLSYVSAWSSVIYRYLLTPDGLRVTMAIETLVCSMFFLAVIVARLRFSDLIHRSKYAIQIAQVYNEKEEDAYQILIEGHAMTEMNHRIQRMQQEIRDSIDKAHISLVEAENVADYMQFFRSMGVWVFVLLLITGGLLLSWVLGVFFILLYAVAILYPHIDRIREAAPTRSLGEQLKPLKRKGRPFGRS